MEIPVATPTMGLASSLISVRTRGAPEFVDITEEIASSIAASGFRSGMALISSQHTTAAIVVNEHEPELLKDLGRLLGEMAPRDDVYAHNRVPCGKHELPNGHAHCQALLLPSSATLPIASGLLVLGRYQRVFLAELDGPRSRSVTVTVLGL